MQHSEGIQTKKWRINGVRKTDIATGQTSDVLGHLSCFCLFRNKLVKGCRGKVGDFFFRGIQGIVTI